MDRTLTELIDKLSHASSILTDAADIAYALGRVVATHKMNKLNEEVVSVMDALKREEMAAK